MLIECEGGGEGRESKEEVKKKYANYNHFNLIR